MDSLSLLVGIASIVLAIVAIWLSNKLSSESRESLEKARQVLAEIDKRSTVMEEKVSENFSQLLRTVTDQVARAYPQQPSTEEMMGATVMQSFLERMTPEQFIDLIQRFQEEQGSGESVE